MGLPAQKILPVGTQADTGEISTDNTKDVPSFLATPYKIEPAANDEQVDNTPTMGIFLSTDPEQKKEGRNVTPLFISNPNKEIKFGATDVIRKRAVNDPISEIFLKDGNFRRELEGVREDLANQGFTPAQIIQILPTIEKRLQNVLNETKKDNTQSAQVVSDAPDINIEMVVKPEQNEVEKIDTTPLSTETTVLRPKISEIRPKAKIVKTEPVQQEVIAPLEIVPPPSIEIDEVRQAILKGEPIQKEEPVIVANPIIEVANQEDTVATQIKAEPTSQELKDKLRAVGNIINIKDRKYTKIEEWAGPTGNSVEVVETDTIDPNMSTKESESWRDSITEIESTLLNDLISMNEKDLITKYVPSYVNPSNPSSWDSVSGFDTYEILNNPNDVFGLTHDPRLEISKLISNMLRIAEVTKSSIKLTQGLTVHILYEQIRSAIASADKRENI